MTTISGGGILDPGTIAFYRRVIEALTRSGVPFLVGGAYAFHRYTGIERHTKDFDVFVRPDDCPRALATLGALGLQTEITYTHWLAKAFEGDAFVDVIFGSGNGAAPVDELWFEHAVEDEVLGLPVRLCPAEEMIWQKAYVMERERYDGADVAHLIRARDLDWDRLRERFARHPHLLLAHVVMFHFIYPGEREHVPDHVLDALLAQVHADLAEPVERGVCRGTLISRVQFLPDITHWGYVDARTLPVGNMTPEQIAHWTAGGLSEG